MASWSAEFNRATASGRVVSGAAGVGGGPLEEMQATSRGSGLLICCTSERFQFDKCNWSETGEKLTVH